MTALPIWLQAGVWGLVAGSALVIGAVVGYFTRIWHRVIASIMAFGSMVAVIAIFLSNIPEGLASAAGMKRARRPAWYVFGVWGGIAIANGVAAALGNLLFIGLSEQVIAATMALAAGAILAMLVDTMIPEAFEVAQDYAGIIAVIGFLAAFYLSKISG